MHQRKAMWLWAVWLWMAILTVPVWASPVNIAVMPFSTRSNDAGAKVLSRQLETQISQTLQTFKRFRVIGDHQIQHAGIAQLSGEPPIKADVLITGRIDQTEGQGSIFLQAMDARKGTEIDHIKLTVDDHGVRQPYIHAWASHLVVLFPYTGTIIKRIRDRVSIDIGKDQGLEPGTYFLVAPPPKKPAIHLPPYDNVGLAVITEVAEKRAEAMILNQRVAPGIDDGFQVRQIEEPLEKGYGMRLDRAGQWEATAQPPLESEVRTIPQNTAHWQYQVPAQNEEGWANLFLYHDPVSVKQRKLAIWLASRKGRNVRLRLYSFLPGTSEKGDIDTYVPVERDLSLTTGYQEIVIDYTRMKVPRWWREEHLQPAVQFNPEDVRVLEFEANAWNLPHGVADILEIHKIVLW